VRGILGELEVYFSAQIERVAYTGAFHGLTASNQELSGECHAIRAGWDLVEFPEVEKDIGINHALRWMRSFLLRNLLNCSSVRSISIEPARRSLSVCFTLSIS
jgi:hypothetical protein